MKNINLTIGILLCLVLIGCESSSNGQWLTDFQNDVHNRQDAWLAEHSVKRENLLKMNKSEVLASLGKPSYIIDSSNQNCKICGPDKVRKCAEFCNGRVEIWMYEPKRNMFGFKILLMEVTFEDGKVRELY